VGHGVVGLFKPVVGWGLSKPVWGLSKPVVYVTVGIVWAQWAVGTVAYVGRLTRWYGDGLGVCMAVASPLL